MVVSILMNIVLNQQLSTKNVSFTPDSTQNFNSESSTRAWSPLISSSVTVFGFSILHSLLIFSPEFIASVSHKENIKVKIGEGILSWKEKMHLVSWKLHSSSWKSIRQERKASTRFGKKKKTFSFNLKIMCSFYTKFSFMKSLRSSKLNADLSEVICSFPMILFFICFQKRIVYFKNSFNFSTVKMEFFSMEILPSSLKNKSHSKKQPSPISWTDFGKESSLSE